MQNDSNLNNSAITLHGVNKQYEHTVGFSLHHIDLVVKRGEFLCIVGPSGCGKSTLLKIIAGIDDPSEGIVDRSEKTSMVFQNAALLPWLTVAENIALGLRVMHKNDQVIQNEITTYVNLLGLTEHLAKYPRELSGGQRQRVGIARAFVVNPQTVLLDEPFSALDVKTSHELHLDILKIWRETKKTIVMVSHLVEEAVALADRVILMKKGTIEKSYQIDLPRPRREHREDFSRLVDTLRLDFFK